MAPDAFLRLLGWEMTDPFTARLVGAALGILASMLQGAPPLGWAIFGIFVAFNGLWTYWYLRLSRQAQ